MAEGGLDGLIGSKISLISGEDIRYEGVLHSINAEESSIVLEKVVCFGTEDRVADPMKKRDGDPNSVFPFVNFPGGEIKDLFVHEDQDTAPASAPAPVPAPKKQHQPKQQQQQQSKQPRPKNEHASGTGDHLLSMRVKAGAEAGSKPEDTKGEFDFDKGLSVFNKTEELAKVGAESDKGATKYVKDDFFDSLSCDVLDRMEGKKTRVTAAEERTQNLDTFGAVALQNNYRRYGGRGRGRGRGGGRGRGRGQGRGQSA